MAGSSGIWIRDAARRVGMTYWQLRKMVLNDGIRYRRRGRRIEVHPDDVRALEESIWQGRPVERREEGTDGTDGTDRTDRTERTEQIAPTAAPAVATVPTPSTPSPQPAAGAAPIVGMDMYLCDGQAPCPSRSVVAGLGYCLRETGGCAWRRRA